MDRAYSIYKTKTHLSEILRAVKRQHTVTITDRGVPVASIVPYAPQEEQALEQRIAELEAAGVLLPAVRSPADCFDHTALRKGALQRFVDERE